MYDPRIQSVQVLRLEKRLDDKLYYLRDAPEEYSTFPLDMEPEILPEGAAVPVNKLQVWIQYQLLLYAVCKGADHWTWSRRSFPSLPIGTESIQIG